MHANPWIDLKWVRLLWNDGQPFWNQRFGLIEVLSMLTWSRVMRITPVQVPQQLLGLGGFCLQLEHGLRDLLQALERGFEFAELRGGGLVERRRFR
jgi:hypothetical protein